MRSFTAVFAALVAAAPLVLAAPAVTIGKETTLLSAAEAGDHTAAMRLLSAKGVNVNATGPDGTTALMYASANDDLDLVRALIKAGANVKLANQLGTSAITEASIIGSAPIIKDLLKAGADANFRNLDGETPLMAAARAGRMDAAKALIDAGADVNAKETWGGQSALMWAAALSQADMVKLLASKDAKLNDHGKVNQWERKIIQEPRPKDMNKGGFTALHYAAREGCVACADYLLKAGADPDSEDPDRETPLLLALENMHFDTAAVLIQGGADLDKWDLFGRSPVYMAADVSTLPMKGNGGVAVIPSTDKLSALDVGRMMLAKGANPNIQLKRRPPYRDVPQDRGGDTMLAQGATPLLRAARGGDDKFVALLLEYKAIVDLPSKEGITPLMAAAGVDYGSRVTRGRNRTDEGVLATMDLLIKAGANVNARSVVDPRGPGGRGGGGPGRGAPPTGSGGAAGFAAGDSASARIAQSFRRGSQMPSASAAPNQTALHGAAEHGFDKYIEFLVAHGADLTAKDAGGRTALDVARGAGGVRGGADAFPKTVALLESLMKAKGIPAAGAPGQ
ncbi:MAG TPA: ankyrin repeat domain-containing protein [Bryobacteraceae bacterium]|jgi:ankyrin repeat protein|nr:ankyrin repeat domain-containing protein [Bryobacteraceae bacterium]